VSGSSPGLKPVGAHSSPSNRPISVSSANLEVRPSGSYPLGGPRVGSKPPTDPKGGDS
jgi:hypothetical protein